MVTKQAVVAEERFASASTYAQYVAQITQNQDEFSDNYNNTAVSDEYKRRLQALTAKANGPKKLVVIGEDWCPDVYRGLPVLQRIAEAAGWDLRVLPRDQNLDVADQYLNQGEFRSIPTALFYTDNLDLLLVWIERPEKATAEMGEMRKLYEGRSREEAAPLVKEFRKGATWAGWRQYTVEDVTQKLEAVVG